MERYKSDKLLQYYMSTVNTIRKIHGFNSQEDMDKAVDELDDWVKKQNHFTKKEFGRHYLETAIIANKGIMERAKLGLEKMCTARTVTPQYFGDFDVRKDFKQFEDIQLEAYLPKLTNDHYRVLFLKNSGKDFTSSANEEFIRMQILFCEYGRMCDYFNGIIGVMDLREVSLLQALKTLRFNDLLRASRIVIECYGARVQGIHLISSSRLISVMVWLLKQVLSAKLSERIQIHRTPKTLTNFFSKDILPEDYEGTEKSLRELHEEWLTALNSEEFKKHVREVNEARVDESRRQLNDNT